MPFSRLNVQENHYFPLDTKSYFVYLVIQNNLKNTHGRNKRRRIDFNRVNYPKKGG